ncbi:type ISP restriction/modification enzyme [Variovorax saccharolyticus]|uniref:type ISP restriction/modification enzyme n=1 Tax=Variovorax saccharolyticus TaxID=3053516 RepID=UPI002578ADE0|nr:type ISP restriction/modification enzyme [Variovorax sp. J22R187]MDM0018367.1 N-6 DNA methylase [Variovorax sp. J22R187]
MSQVLINQYLADLTRLKKVSGEKREGIVSEAFKDLLKGWGRQHDLVFIPQYKLESLTKDKRYVDGALLHELRVPFGYWEAKDDADDIDEEIVKKFKRGYPQDNIIFEDSTQAVLIQNRKQVMRCGVADPEELEKLLKLFFSYERSEIANFRHAVAQFKADLPAVLEALRTMIEREHRANTAFAKASKVFLKHAQEAINPSLSAADVREMLIQHILTEEIFSKVFDSEFHRDNNVAKELYKLEGTFFTGSLKKNTLKGLEAYYAAIRAAAAQIGNHHEKQTFLKVIYENFYKVYNAKAADRLGVVYTPNEIVRFMIEGADWLCEKHFGRNLIDKDVEILDPATGTGTFISELLEYFSGQPKKLAHKYKDELHANEVAILPYYVANLNIEATYAAITGEYAEFQNLCFVDTLDNVGLHTQAHGVTADLFGSVSEENVARIKRQNSRKISVIIGNPPYNANQANENDNNKNREYPEVDARIKQTYIHESTAQKTKLYDMYARFFRWASDRLDANGVLAFVTNRSFIESRTFDGFRKVVAQEFAELYVVDLGGDVRANPKLSGTKHNVFGIQTGVAISFLVKRKGSKGGRVFYTRRPELETAEEKLSWLGSAALSRLAMEEVRPDAKQNWLNLTSNDFDEHMPVVSDRGKAIFSRFASAVKTNRDEWVYGFNDDTVIERAEFLVDRFNAQRKRGLKDSAALDYSIKWSSSLKKQSERLEVRREKLVRSTWRPFVKQWYYSDKPLSDRLTRNHFEFFGPNLTDDVAALYLPGPPLAKEPHVLAISGVADYHVTGDAITIPRSLHGFDGGTVDNITDWSLAAFKKHYQPGRGKKLQPITKEAIFHYVYAVLHDSVYRAKYAQNLKREFPRIPLYGGSEADFWQWSAWGNALMTLHIGYEQAEPFALVRSDVPDKKVRASGQSPKCILKADKGTGRIVIDSETALTGVPAEAWTYMLGARSAIDWVLDQYKEKKVKDPTIREKFNTYRFEDHKEQVIELLAKVTTVSVQTVRVLSEMQNGTR